MFASCLCEVTGFGAVKCCASAQVCIVPLQSHSSLFVPCVCSLSLCVYLRSLASGPGLSACALSPALAGGGICPFPQQ